VTFPKFEVLNLWNCCLTDANLLTLLSKSGEKLTKLVLWGTGLSLSGIGSGVPWLEKLSLTWCYNFTEEGLISLLNKVGVHLKKLDLKHSTTYLSQVDALTATFPKLKELNLEGCKNIAKVRLLSFKTLNLNWSHVGEDCVTNVRAQYPNMTVKDNYVEEEGYGDEEEEEDEDEGNYY